MLDERMVGVTIVAVVLSVLALGTLLLMFAKDIYGSWFVNYYKDRKAVRLIQRLRRKGRNKIDIVSVTTTDGTVTGMSIAYSPGDEKYGSLFSFGDTKEEVYKKAEDLYIKEYYAKLKVYPLNTKKKVEDVEARKA